MVKKATSNVETCKHPQTTTCVNRDPTSRLVEETTCKSCGVTWKIWGIVSGGMNG